MSDTFIAAKTATDHTSWQKEICPGCYFVWFAPTRRLAIFAKVLPTSPEVVRQGRRYAQNFANEFPLGRTGSVPVSDACMLLSHEQFEKARSLGWPSDEPTLMKVLDTPAN